MARTHSFAHPSIQSVGFARLPVPAGMSPHESKAKAAKCDGRTGSALDEPTIPAKQPHLQQKTSFFRGGNIPRLSIQMPEQRSPAVVVGGDKEVGMSAFGLFVHPSGFEQGCSMAHRGSNLGAESHVPSELKYSNIMKRSGEAGSATV
jgi:hypothetical protein